MSDPWYFHTDVPDGENYDERGGVSGKWIATFSLTGHDRDVALAIWNQARMRRHRLDEIQVEHLMAIGYRAGFAAASAHARTLLRDDKRNGTWWLTARTGRSLPEHLAAQHLAADYLEEFDHLRLLVPLTEGESP